VSVSVRALAGVLVVLASIIGVSPQVPRAKAGTESPPNILVIVTDDQRADTMGVMDATRRWFRREGVAFPEAVATTPMCCPARASIFTGMYVHNHLVRGNHDSARLDHRATVQRYLQEAGYRTGIVGKYFNDWDLEHDPPYFHRWAIFRAGYRDRPYNVNGQVRRISRYSTRFIGDRARRFLESSEARDNDPWLLFVTPNAPHRRRTPEPRYADAPIPEWNGNPAIRERDRTDKPLSVQNRHFTLDDGRMVRKEQLRTLLSVDDMVARLMQKLGRLGERRRTLALYLSDNGYLLGEHGLLGKRWPYEPAIRVPLFLRWPGHVAEGTEDRRLAANIDLVPTMLDAAGIAPEPEYPLDGRTLLGTGTRDRILVEHFIDPLGPDIPAWSSVVTRELLFVEHYEPDAGAVAFREYYDFVNDPWELTNLYADRDPTNDPPPEETARLSAMLARDRRCEGTSGPSACP
jgi:arylsulfatase A-like enzyme